MTSSDTKAVQRKLLAWYRQGLRPGLPWRQTCNPYRIWISEAMLQQTQVETVIPYYHRFLKKFPTVQALAKAPLTEVLDVWSGLGYYSRAKNLHAAARQIVASHGGHIPDQIETLMRLPGVGRYTAGAIASIAFGKPAPVLDGNVIRVLTRLFAVRRPPQEPNTQRRLWRLAEALLPKADPGSFNQALMDLGALVCLPRQPHCLLCPISENCLAYQKGLQEKIPLPKTALRRKTIRYVCGILEKNGSVLLARRPISGLLPGLWEFPGGQIPIHSSATEKLTELLSERLGLNVEPDKLHVRMKQLLTHRELHIEAFSCRWHKAPSAPTWYTQVRWVPRRDLPQTALTGGMAKVARTL